VSELVDLLGCDDAEDVRVVVDAVAEASGRAVRRLRPKGSDEVRAYRLVGVMKCQYFFKYSFLQYLINGDRLTVPSHFARARRSTRLIDSKRPTHIHLADVVNQPWDQTSQSLRSVTLGHLLTLISHNSRRV
jgi:hypothetical protein